MTAKFDEPHIGLVVEGAGDKLAVPLLFRQHLQGRQEFREVLGKPIPVNGRGNAVAAGGVEGYVATAAARPGCRAVLVLLDGEGDCVARLGTDLLARARTKTGKEVVVALADRDFEDWLHCSAESLQLEGLVYEEGKRGQAAIRTALFPRGYVKPVWQPRLTARMDLHLARSRSPSLTRVLDRLDALIRDYIG